MGHIIKRIIGSFEFKMDTDFCGLADLKKGLR